MGNLAARLKKVQSNYAKATAARSGGGYPKGTYTYEIKAAKCGVEKLGDFYNDVVISLEMAVCIGPHKGSKGKIQVLLMQPEREMNGKTMPSGVANLKAIVEGQGLDMLELTEKGLKSVLRELKGQKLIGFHTGSYGRVYYNGPVDTDDTEINDDLEDEDGDEDEEFDDDEADDDDFE